VTALFAIARREFLGLFASPLAYAAGLAFLGLVATFTLWLNDLFEAGFASMSLPFRWMALGLAFVGPALTMRSIAEERRLGTFELLATLPVSSTSIVLGKWLAVSSFLLTLVAATLPWPWALSQWGDLDAGPVIAGYAGLALVACAFAAIGILASSLTENPAIAWILSAVCCLTPWVLGWFLGALPGGAVNIIQYFTFEYHFSNLARGALDTRSVVFFASVIAFCLQAAASSLEYRRAT